jgi:hypothetical protein
MRAILKILLLVISCSSTLALPAGEIDEKDFAAFQYVLGLDQGSEATESKNSPLAKRARAELLLSGNDSRELYAKFDHELRRLQEVLRPLFLMQSKIERNDYQSQTKCVELGICVGLVKIAFGVSLNVGYVRKPLFSYPVMGLKMFVHPSFMEPEIAFGAAAFLGVESTQSPDDLVRIVEKRSDGVITNTDDKEEKKKKFEAHKTSKISGGAVGPVGMYKFRMNEKELSQGIMMGLYLAESKNPEHMSIRVPVKIPFYFFSLRGSIEKELRQLTQAFHRLDLNAVDVLVGRLADKIHALVKKMEGRGVKLHENEVQDYRIPGHFASLGRLFHPQSLMSFSPALVPNEFRDVLSCDSALSKKAPDPLLLSQ